MFAGPLTAVHSSTTTAPPKPARADKPDKRRSLDQIPGLASTPPTVEEIIAVMHAAGDDRDAIRLRGLIIVLWRAGLRISEALALAESDLDLHRGAILVRHGKGGKRREVGMDRWGKRRDKPAWRRR